jgi:hypothetical protein
MPRLVRRRPLLERLQAYLNPLDFLLWVSEEIETRDWDDQSFSNPVGAALNFVFLLARANSGPSRSNRDDVFGDGNTGPGWFSWLVSDHSKQQTLLTDLFTVNLRRLYSCLFLYRQCCIHISSKAPLPSIRERNRRCPGHSKCTSSEGGQLPDFTRSHS